MQDGLWIAPNAHFCAGVRGSAPPGALRPPASGHAPPDGVWLWLNSMVVYDFFAHSQCLHQRAACCCAVSRVARRDQTASLPRALGTRPSARCCRRSSLGTRQPEDPLQHPVSGLSRGLADPGFGPQVPWRPCQYGRRPPYLDPCVALPSSCALSRHRRGPRCRRQLAAFMPHLLGACRTPLRALPSQGPRGTHQDWPVGSRR